tara:strand:+ start:1742 stop:1984 length:243 start_codon:yes stop_codon:yes gene_type:complete
MIIPSVELENLARDADQLSQYVRKANTPETALDAVKWTNAISVRLMDLMAIYLVPTDIPEPVSSMEIARSRWFARLMRRQ